MSGYILAIDQGTTSSRAIIFDEKQEILAVSQQEFAQHFPASGWVEHDGEEIWLTVLATAREALLKAGLSATNIAAIGITNQRETSLVWERSTARPLHRAIVWQDRRTAKTCAAMKESGHEPLVTEKTGLLLDPYFSATKLAWILNEVDGLRERAANGEVCFGTIDSWIIYKLTGGKVHATDATNASRTMLYNIEKNEWDDELLNIFHIPQAMLPEVKDCASDFGTTEADLFGGPIAIRGVAGDQQAATIGNACFKPGMMKSTYGTGCFALLNTGNEKVSSHNRLLTTIAYRLDGKTTYALEGSIFIAGAAVQWLRDGLGIIGKASDSGVLAEKADENQEIYLVPAFTGLGAPHWDAEARGAIYGISRGTGPAEFAKATLESVAFQTFDLLDAMHKDWKREATAETVLRVDGGMVASDWAMQCLSDILGAPVDRPKILETTALGAAWLAGSAAGVWPGEQGFSEKWALDTRFTPEMQAGKRAEKLKGWHAAVKRTLTN